MGRHRIKIADSPGSVIRTGGHLVGTGMKVLFRSRLLLAAAVAAAVTIGAGAIALATGPSSMDSDTLGITLEDGDVRLDRDRVFAGSTFLDAFNEGTTEHELLLIRTDTPSDELPRGIAAVSLDLAGELAVGADHEVHDHDGEEEDRGPEPGNALRVRTKLEPGRYVVLCNIPGHYAAGEHAELEVIAPPD